MEIKDFSKQYQSPKWQKKRLEILERDNFSCKFCSDSESVLHVHHLSYEKGCKVWEYPNDNLITLCDECHKIIHMPFNMIEGGILKVEDFVKKFYYAKILFYEIENHKGRWILKLRNAYLMNNTFVYSRLYFLIDALRSFAWFDSEFYVYDGEISVDFSIIKSI